MKYYSLLLDGVSPKRDDWMNTGHVHFVMQQLPEAVKFYVQAQSFEKSHTDFIGKFYKDKTTLLGFGLTEDDLRIMMDLVCEEHKKY